MNFLLCKSYFLSFPILLKNIKLKNAHVKVAPYLVIIDGFQSFY